MSSLSVVLGDVVSQVLLGEHQTATDKEDLTNNIAQHHRKT